MSHDAAFRQGRTFSESLDTVQENVDKWHSTTRFTRGARPIPVVVLLDEEGDEEGKEQGWWGQLTPSDFPCRAAPYGTAGVSI